MPFGCEAALNTRLPPPPYVVETYFRDEPNQQVPGYSREMPLPAPEKELGSESGNSPKYNLFQMGLSLVSGILIGALGVLGFYERQARFNLYDFGSRYQKSILSLTQGLWGYWRGSPDIRWPKPHVFRRQQSRLGRRISSRLTHQPHDSPTIRTKPVEEFETVEAAFGRGDFAINPFSPFDDTEELAIPNETSPCDWFLHDSGSDLEVVQTMSSVRRGKCVQNPLPIYPFVEPNSGVYELPAAQADTSAAPPRKIVSCNICDFSVGDDDVNRKTNLRRRMKKAREGALLKCDFCLTTFSRRDNLQAHVRKYHPETKIGSGSHFPDRRPPSEQVELGATIGYSRSDVLNMEGLSPP